jgi:hypothetical protein
MRHTLKAVFYALVICFLIIRPTSSIADWNGHGGHGHDGDGRGHEHHEHHDRSFVGFNFSLWPDSYYYSAPYYPPADDVLVSPPVYSYQTVEPPVTVIQQPVTIVQPATISTPEVGGADSFTINIPNNNGGYTAVTLKRSGNGYIGPQVEFYPEFPKVSHLQVIYGNVK